MRIGAVAALAAHPESTARLAAAIDDVADPRVRASGLAFLRAKDEHEVVRVVEAAVAAEAAEA